jgi:hypothetical protein
LVLHENEHILSLIPIYGRKSTQPILCICLYFFVCLFSAEAYSSFLNLLLLYSSAIISSSFQNVERALIWLRLMRYFSKSNKKLGIAWMTIEFCSVVCLCTEKPTSKKKKKSRFSLFVWYKECGFHSPIELIKLNMKWQHRKKYQENIPPRKRTSKK